jgi:hypothetical protein
MHMPAGFDALADDDVGARGVAAMASAAGRPDTAPCSPPRAALDEIGPHVPKKQRNGPGLEASRQFLVKGRVSAERNELTPKCRSVRARTAAISRRISSSDSLTMPSNP